MYRVAQKVMQLCLIAQTFRKPQSTYMILFTDHKSNQINKANYTDFRPIAPQGKIIPNITNFNDLGIISPQFKTTTVKFGVMVRTCMRLLLYAKFCKNRLRRFVPYRGKLYKKYKFYDTIVGI